MSDATDVRGLKPYQSMNEKTLRTVLRGEYCELEIMLPPENELIKETNYETFIQEGQLHCRVKEKKRELDYLD